MKEHFIMYSIVETASGKCVHVDTEAMCITFAMLLSIGTKGNVVINLSPKRSCRKIVRSELTRQFQLSWITEKGYVCYKQCGISFQNQRRFKQKSENWM